jgi:hypothetical protein
MTAIDFRQLRPAALVDQHSVKRSHPCCAAGVMQCTPTNMSWHSAIVDDTCAALQADS